MRKTRGVGYSLGQYRPFNSTKDLAQDLLSRLEFLGLYIYRPDILVFKI